MSYHSIEWFGLEGTWAFYWVPGRFSVLWKQMSIFKNLSLKIKAIESLQYFEISPVLNTKHMNSSILKWLHPFIKAFQIEKRFLHILLQTQEKQRCLHRLWNCKMPIGDKGHLCLEEKEAVVASWPQSWEQTSKNQDKRPKPWVHSIILLQSSLNSLLWQMSLSDLPLLKPGHPSDGYYINKLE